MAGLEQLLFGLLLSLAEYMSPFINEIGEALDMLAWPVPSSSSLLLVL